jgi:DNA-binding SARP family transcriptional activator/tetratricopeptide (TPR) repeat protein
LEQGRVVAPRSDTLRRLAVALDLSAADVAELAHLGGRGPVETSGVRLGILGPLTVRMGGTSVDLGSDRQRLLLGLLALSPGTPVSLDAIIELLWGASPPAAAVTLVQARISRLRRRLRTQPTTELIVAARGGYQLCIEGECLDLLEFRLLARQARSAGDAGLLPAALAHYRAAIGLWRGDVLADLAPIRQHPNIAELESERQAAVLNYADIAAALGRHEEVLGPLRQLTTADPLHEPSFARLMVALAGSGQPAAALTAYDEMRRRLAAELGVDPCADLQRLYQAILREEPAELSTMPKPVGRGSAVSLQPAGSALSRAPVPRQLPPDVAAFTGRADSLRTLDSLLDRRRKNGQSPVLFAIIGPPGIGKTALAVHWAHRSADRFPDGQLYANLRGFDPSGQVTTPAEALRGFLSALGVPWDGIPPDLDAQAALYRSLVAGKRMLVVLDNARDPGQVRPLLPGTHAARTVVTSRNQLTGLVAVDGACPLYLDLLSTQEARELLALRLGRDRAAAEPDAVAQVITACARLPLALVVAAARARQSGLPVSVLAAELINAGRPLDTLDAGEAASQVRAAFSWSYQALTPATARLFRLLGVHPGPYATAQDTASLAGAPIWTARRLLAELVRSHLLTECAPERYALHDLLREYAAELAQAVESPAERQAAVLRLLDHHLYTAHAAAMLLQPHRAAIHPVPPRPGVAPEKITDAEHALGWFAAEHHVLLAMARMAAREGHDRHVWQLAWALANFLDRRAQWSDLAAIHRLALGCAQRAADRLGQAHVLRGLGLSQARQSHHEVAVGQLRAALELFAALGDLAGAAHTHLDLGWVAVRQDDIQQALAHGQAALAGFAAAGHDVGQANALNAIGWCHTRLGRHEQARDCCQQALDILQRVGDVHGEAHTWDSLGYAHHQLGDHPRAAEAYRRSVALFRRLGDRYFEADALRHLAETYLAANDPGSARAAWQQALEILVELAVPDAEHVRAALGALNRVPVHP